MEKLFKPGVDRVLYTKAVYGEEEIEAVTKTLREGWLGPAKYTEEFEKQVTKIFGKKYGLFLNSGTSANMLAMETAGIPKGSEVITQACTFPATLSPIVLQGYIPVFVDSIIGSYNIDIDQIEAAISEKTRAIFISHAIGNVNDMKRIRDICDRYNLLFIEDACDTIGCRFAGRPTGEYSDITTASFYAAHNITAAGGGGMVMTDDPEVIHEARIITDWGRALPTSFDTNIQERLSTQLEDHTYFDGKFTFIRLTYNFKGVEAQAAFGLEQLKKLPQFNRIRIHNMKRLHDIFSKYPEHVIVPDILPDAEAYFIAFPLTIHSHSQIERRHLLTYLEERNIQTRTLFAGNILRHPAYKDIPCRVYGTLTNADTIMKNSFLIGCHHGMTDDMIDYIAEVFDEYIQQIEAEQRHTPEAPKEVYEYHPALNGDLPLSINGAMPSVHEIEAFRVQVNKKLDNIIARLERNSHYETD